MTVSGRGRITQGPRSLQEIELAIRDREESRRSAPERAWEAPCGATEIRIAAIWCEVIGLNRVGRNDHFFEIGGHSLAAVALLGRIRDELDKEPTLLDVLEAPVLQQFALRVDLSPAQSRPAKTQVRVRRIPRAPLAAHYPTTPGQRQVWLHQQAFPASAAYHITGSFVASAEFRIEGGLLERAALKIMERHASLRTVFRQHQGLPVQCVLESLQPVIRYGHAPSQAVEETIRSFVREPFDLERGPLARLLHLECTDTGVRTLTWAVHHIVCDGVSLRNISREFLRLLLNPQVQLPAPPEVRFVDYACWQEDAEELRTAGDWWRAMLQDLPPRLQLPVDRAADTSTGAFCVEIPAELRERVHLLSLKSGATPFVVYLCALSALLGRVCKQQDFLVGLLTAGRNRATIQNIVGYFANVCPFRVRLNSAKGFEDLLAATRAQLVDVLRYQEYPFSRMLEDVNATAESMEFPLTPLLFNMLPENASTAAFADRRLGHWTLYEEARVDLELRVVQHGEETSLAVYYPRRLFRPATIESIVDAYVTLLGQGLSSPECPLSQLELLSPARQRQLVEWNDTAASYPRDAAIHQLFEQQAHRTPEAAAVVFEDETLTYRQLNARANQLARHLRSEGVGPEVLVGLCVERSLEMVVGLLAIVKAGGAYVPLDPDYPRERVAFMLRDSAPKLVLSQERLLPRLPAEGTVLCLDRDWPRIANQEAHDLDNLTQPANLAYVIYTSGSTGQPKGVQIPMSALVNLVSSMARTPGIEASDTLLAITSLSFDIAGLEIFLPLTHGAGIVVASRAQVMEGAAIQSLCLRSGITFVQATPSTWRMLKEQAPNLRLRMALCGGEALDPALAGYLCRIADQAWNVYGPTETTIWSTADRLVADQPFGLGRPIANTQIHILDEALMSVPVGVAGELHIGGAGLARGYLNRPELTTQKFIGAAEHRLYKTGDLARLRADGNIEYLGRIDNQVKLRGVRIELGEIESVLQQQEGVRQAVAMVREDVPGEQRLVAYVVMNENDPALGRRRVEAQRDGWREVLGGPYTVGDDAQRQHDVAVNMASCTSSYDKLPIAAQQLSLAGAGDRAFHAVQSCGDADVDWQGAEECETSEVMANTPAAPYLAPLICDALRQRLAQHLPKAMVPGTFVLLRELPLTPNGKVDRSALPGPDGHRQSVRAYVVPRTPTEQALARIWAAVLRVDKVGLHDNFFELGGHSLLAARVVSLISQDLGRELSLRSLFEYPELAALASRLDDGSEEVQAILPIRPVPRDGDLLLSYAQQRLWFLDLYDDGHAAYNIPATLRLEGPVEAALVQRTFDVLIARHESLRTVFGQSGGLPVQIVRAPSCLQVRFSDLSGLAQEERESRAREQVEAEAREPFDLAQGPLLRICLLKLGEQSHLLHLTIHHIVSDGWSMGVLVQEVARIYEALRAGREAQLTGPAIQYADYAAWQRERLQGEYLGRQLAYWKAQLHGATPLLGLPTDRPRPAVQRHYGSSLEFSVQRQVTAKLHDLARQQGATLFMVLQAAFAVLLHRYSGQSDICVGTPIAGRNRAEFEGLIGLFVNTLVLRTRIDPRQSFVQLLGQVKEMALQAYAHQEVPFEQLVEELKPERSLSHSPLFQVMFILQNAPRDQLRIEGLSFGAVASHSGRSKFDLTLSLAESSEGLQGSLEYDTDLFDAATVRRLSRHYALLLGAICADATVQVGDLSMLTRDEERQLLMEWNNTHAAYPRELAVHQLFEQQARRSPQARAVISEAGELTYAQLDARANQLAWHLRGQGVGPDVLVGLFIDRSLEMVVALLAVLKAGGAYLPLDASYPRERIAFMLQDAAPGMILTQERLLPKLPHDGPVLCLDRDWARVAKQPAKCLPVVTQPDHLAYVTYTSGSTGQPKGVQAQHQSVVNYLWFVSRAYAITPADRVLQIPSLSFDASVRDILGTLVSGAELHLLTDAAAGSPFDIREQMHKGGMTALLSITPSLLELVAAAGEEELATLRLLLVSGEALSAPLVESVALRMGRRVQIVNQYGPTECTMTSTFHRVQNEGPIHIGRPIPNVRTYILDPQQRPVPVGVAGELYIGGVGVSRGYLNRPELTAQKFLANPFEAPGSCMYRTGDVARYLPDGNIEYLGRRDHQVKLRGFRVELEEIESVLRQQECVAQAVVAVHGETPRLVAYVVPAGLDLQQLHAALKARLPEPMLPATYVPLDSLPLTANGKVDRHQLPGLDGQRAAQTEYVAPRNAVEDSLVRIWADVLKVERVGVNDSFFELGGHSLLATMLVGRVKEAFDVHVRLQELFHTPTVAHMAKCIDQGLALSSLLSAPAVSADMVTLEF
jgi:amino acid adenylation domain-containing protein